MSFQRPGAAGAAAAAGYDTARGPIGTVPRRIARNCHAGAVEHALLQRARAGDEIAFSGLVAPHRRELQVHCYRMLGSLTDAKN